MKLGVNLSFAVKRWLGGAQLAAIVKEELGIDRVQFTWDLVDPWWPEALRDPIARDYAKAFKAAGIEIESSFGGLASYTYNHFLAPTDELRQLGKQHLRRAIDMTSEMQVPVVGMPLGSYSADDAVNPMRREEIYKQALEAIVDISIYAKQRGMKAIMIEPVPLATEFPSSAEDSLQLMKGLEGESEIPVRLCVDWGHALFQPLFGDQANMDHWMGVCGDYIACFHIQQTDGLLDRHWSFTRKGLVTPNLLSHFETKYQQSETTFFMEIMYPFEEPDGSVLSDMKQAVALLKEHV